MTTFERSPRAQSAMPPEKTARLLSVFKRATLRGDPTAVYQAILMCSEHQIAVPDWLTNHLLKLIADYHLGNKPSWKGVGKRPLIIVRRRFEDEVRRRAVLAVKAWVKDRTQYQAMPKACIQAWNRQDYMHQQMGTDGDALEFASYGLQGIKLQADGPLLKCSTRTLRRAMQNKSGVHPPKLSSRIAGVFGLTDPDSLFGYDKPLKQNLK